MYRILCDNVPIFDPRDTDLVLIDPKVHVELNSPGTCTFSIPPGHPQYDLPQPFLSRIEVQQDGVQLFKGRVTNISLDYWNRKAITCEGELAFLNDSHQPQAEYHDISVRDFLATLISYHNRYVEADKQFEVGIVTVKDSNDSLYHYTNRESTLQCIKEKLIDTLGGYVRVRNENGHRYIDYINLDEYGNKNTQDIAFGENLADLVRNMDLTDIATVVIPLGARQDESPIKALDNRLTIASVNNGVEYLTSPDAVKKYGWIEKVVTWDDVTTPERLKSKGQKWLTDEQFDPMVINAKAVDLHYTDDQIESLKLGDQVHVISIPHGLDRWFPISELNIDINKVSNNTVTFGETVSESLSTRQTQISASLGSLVEQIPVPNAIVKAAIEQATNLITHATHGYVTLTDDASELYICDQPDYTQAKKLWRWNLNGLGYSKNGKGGPYETAITMDGQILGNRVVANSIDGSKLTMDYKTSVTQEIADAEESARQDSEDYADQQLKNYYTKSEIQTTIQNTRDSILLSAKETATQYTDNQLKSYATSASVKITTDSITQEVNKRVGYTDVISAINQSAEQISIKASKIALEGLVTANKNFKIDQYGNMWANNGTFTGTITGTTITGSTLKIEESSGVKLSFDTNGIEVDARNYKNIYGNYGGCTRMWTSNSILSSSTSSIQYTTKSGATWYSLMGQDLNELKFIWKPTGTSYVEIQTIFGAWGISVWASDRKYKENIIDSDVCATDEIMKIQHRAFDWKTTKAHVACGYVAQEMRQINPNFVSIFNTKDADGKMTGQTNWQIDERGLIPVITKALQETIARVEKLERK